MSVDGKLKAVKAAWLRFAEKLMVASSNGCRVGRQPDQ